MRVGTVYGCLSGWIAFGAPLALYAATAAPGVQFWDSGEMQTAPFVLGIAHPTGFPFFVLLGAAVDRALPFGDPAHRVTLLSCAATAAAARLLAAAARELGCARAVAAAGACAFALGDVVWTRAVRAEVHDVALALLALAIVAALRASRTLAPRDAALCALAAGCALATHPAAALGLPCVALLAWPYARHAGPRRALAAAALALAPLALYAYVPLRAHALGLEPATWPALARYLAGAAYRPQDAFAALATLEGRTRAYDAARSVLSVEYGAILAALVLTGFASLALRAPRVAAALATIPLGWLAFAPNYGAESDAARYALPALWTAGACAALGASTLGRAVFARRARFAAALAAALLALGAAQQVAYAARDVAYRRAYDDARGLGPAIARATPDDAVIEAPWAFATPLVYESSVARGFGRRTVRSSQWWLSPGDPAPATGSRPVYYVADAGASVAHARTVARGERWQLVTAAR